jgi:hypothetical protein
MNLRRAASIAVCMLAVTAGSTAAQAPWPAPQQPAASPWAAPPQQQPAASPWTAPAAQQPAASPWTAQPQQEPPCIREFDKLRNDAQKRANAIQQAGQRKAPPKEACALFNAFAAAEVKMIKFATDQAATCGIPPELLINLKKGHERTSDIRSKICQAAARPQGPAAPSLSDALTAPVADSKNIRTGGGTFDTLSGSPLGPR